MQVETTEVFTSANPVLHRVFQDSIDAAAADVTSEELRDFEMRKIACNVVQADTERVKDLAINSAMTLIFLVQAPAGFMSFAISPTLEWELIAALSVSLLVLKVLAGSHPSHVAVALGALLGNVLMGCITGEVIHFGFELAHQQVGGLTIAASIVALGFTILFYATLIGDIIFIKKRSKMMLNVSRSDERVIITETLLPLTKRDRWWITWGVSTSFFFSPLLVMYLLARLSDWLAAMVFDKIVVEIFGLFRRGGR